MLRGKQGILSLAQGIVFWKPPEEATEAARVAGAVSECAMRAGEVRADDVKVWSAWMTLGK